MINNNAEQIYRTSTLEKNVPVAINFEPNINHIEYTASYIPHSTIMIFSDVDFGNYNLSGIGMEVDPYIIENFNITTTNDTAITIQNTTKHFIIRNCLLRADNFGIYLFNTSWGTGRLENNDCSITNSMGIWGKNAHGTIIVNNTCSKNSRCGILLKECNSVIIIDNICEKNPRGGIILEGCSNSEVRDNFVLENRYGSGIKLHYSNGARVINNTCINNEVAGIRCYGSNYAVIEHNFVYSDNYWGGISVVDSLYVSVLNNTITSDRISLSFIRSYNACIKHNNLYFTGLEFNEYDILQYQFLDIEGNYVNNKKLGFFANLKKTKIEEPDYGQLILVNCENFVIKNQRNDEGFVGITIYKCNFIEIEDSKITPLNDNIRTWGVRVYDSDHIDIINNICINGRGIYLENTKNALIKSNLCKNGTLYGIHLENADYCILINNTCKFNSWSGMIISLSDYCEIIYNRIESNGFSEFQGFGLSIGGSNNILHHNVFLENTFNGTIQAADSGTNNTWYEEKAQEGNFWDTWSGVGPYLIYGDSNSTDPYPLSKIPVYSNFNYKNFYYFFLILIPIFAYPIHKANKFLKEIRID